MGNIFNIYKRIKQYIFNKKFPGSLYKKTYWINQKSFVSWFLFKGRSTAKFLQYRKIVSDEQINIRILLNASVANVRLLFIYVVNEAFRVSEGLWKGENLRPKISRVRPERNRKTGSIVKIRLESLQNTYKTPKIGCELVQIQIELRNVNALLIQTDSFHT